MFAQEPRPHVSLAWDLTEHRAAVEAAVASANTSMVQIVKSTSLAAMVRSHMYDRPIVAQRGLVQIVLLESWGIVMMMCLPAGGQCLLPGWTEAVCYLAGGMTTMGRVAHAKHIPSLALTHGEGPLITASSGLRSHRFSMTFAMSPTCLCCVLYLHLGLHSTFWLFLQANYAACFAERAERRHIWWRERPMAPAGDRSHQLSGGTSAAHG